MRFTEPRRMVSIAISDLGLGVPEHIRQRYPRSSPRNLETEGFHSRSKYAELQRKSTGSFGRLCSGGASSCRRWSERLRRDRTQVSVGP
jgi:hypothetical protein